MNLKLSIIILTLLLGLCSCEQSNEEKAQQMAANYLKGVILDFDSYEPIQTKVDSSKVSLTTDIEAINLLNDLLKLFQSIEKYKSNISMYESSMDIHAPNGYTTQFNRGKYNRAKQNRDENQNLLEKTIERAKSQFEKIKTRQSQLKTGEFNGWKVYHKYKTWNGFEEYIFICDKDFHEESVHSKQEFDILTFTLEIIAQSEDLPEFIENVQDYAYRFDITTQL